MAAKVAKAAANTAAAAVGGTKEVKGQVRLLVSDLRVPDSWFVYNDEMN